MDFKPTQKLNKYLSHLLHLWKQVWKPLNLNYNNDRKIMQHPASKTYYLYQETLHKIP